MKSSPIVETRKWYFQHSQWDFSLKKAQPGWGVKWQVLLVVTACTLYFKQNIFLLEKWGREEGKALPAPPAPPSLWIALRDCFGDAITSLIGCYEVVLITGQDSSPITFPWCNSSQHRPSHQQQIKMANKSFWNWKYLLKVPRRSQTLS